MLSLWVLVFERQLKEKPGPISFSWFPFPGMTCAPAAGLDEASFFMAGRLLQRYPLRRSHPDFNFLPYSSFSEQSLGPHTVPRPIRGRPGRSPALPAGQHPCCILGGLGSPSPGVTVRGCVHPGTGQRSRRRGPHSSGPGFILDLITSSTRTTGRSSAIGG